MRCLQPILQGHQLVVRATDRDGILRPEAHRGISPSGAVGYLHVQVRVA